MLRTGDTWWQQRFAVLACVIALGVGGCGTTSTDTDPIPAPTSAAPTPSPTLSLDDVDADQQYQLGDVAQFDDGLEFSTAGAEVARATATQRGAEGTDGQIVVVSILITNSSTESYDPRSTVVTALYGPQLTPATVITDSAADLLTGFEAPIGPGDEGTAALGFAVPDAGLAQVTFIVDPQDDEHAAMSFTGRIEKSG